MAGSLEDVAGARGLGISSSTDRLSLLVSSSLVRDTLLPTGLPWTLGGYTNEFDGVQARGKRTFGIYLPPDLEDEEDKEANDGAKEEQVVHSIHVPQAINYCVIKYTTLEKGLVRSGEDPSTFVLVSSI